MSNDLRRLSLSQAAAALRHKEFSARELSQAYLHAIDRHNSDLNCYITVSSEQALAMADASDKRLAAGTHGLLEGLPLAIKDLFCTTGVRTTAASHILHNFIPPYESTVTAKLWQAGAVMLGKANLDEFAMGSSNLTSYFGKVRNPWRRKSDREGKVALVPGGSSGGSASAVAAGLALAATGTDTGGSIRQPAAFCGLTGIKPSYGRCSRYGVIAFASSLDQPGPITRTVADAALMLAVMCGHDERDSTSPKVPVPDFQNSCLRGVKGLRVGIPQEFRNPDLAPSIAKYWQQAEAWLRDRGATIVSVNLPNARYALPVYYIIAPAEASSNLARYDGVRFGLRADKAQSLGELYEETRSLGFGAEVKRRILIGTYVLSAGYYDAYYLKAQKLRRLIHDDFATAFEQCDVILSPSTPTTAFATDDKQDDPLTMYLNDIYTVPANLAGLPAMSVPVGLDEQGLPIGLQLIGRRYDEETLLASGQVIEEAAQFPFLPPMPL